MPRREHRFAAATGRRTMRRMYADRTSDRTHRYTVREAAELLGISAEAVRARVRRNTLEHEKDASDGTVYVRLQGDDHQNGNGTHDGTADRTALVEVLRGEVEHLRSQLDSAREAEREQRRIIAGLVQRIPAIEAAEAPQSAAQDAGGYEPHPDNGAPERAAQRPAEAQQDEHRSWWRRIFTG